MLTEYQLADFRVRISTADAPSVPWRLSRVLDGPLEGLDLRIPTEGDCCSWSYTIDTGPIVAEYTPTDSGLKFIGYTRPGYDNQTYDFPAAP